MTIIRTLTPVQRATLLWLPADGNIRVVDGFDRAIALADLEHLGFAVSGSPSGRDLALWYRLTEAGEDARNQESTP